MKTNSSLFAPISKIAVEALTMEVKESLANLIHPNGSKKFSTADLWNIRRKRRTALLRRNFI